MGCALIPRLRAKLREYWPLTAALLTLSWPVMLENAMQTLVQYVDTAMVGVLGAQASAAVGLTGSVTWLVNGVFFAAGIGAWRSSPARWALRTAAPPARRRGSPCSSPLWPAR